MGYLNYEFLEEFKSLDNLCRDIYGETTDNKLGVTLYLEDMGNKAYQGSAKVSGWSTDYYQLKAARNLRNELSHSRNSFPNDICSQSDIDFVRSFKRRILNGTDPIALLRKEFDRSLREKQELKKAIKQAPPTPKASTKTQTGNYMNIDASSKYDKSNKNIAIPFIIIGGILAAAFLAFLYFIFCVISYI